MSDSSRLSLFKLFVRRNYKVLVVSFLMFGVFWIGGYGHLLNFLTEPIVDQISGQSSNSSAVQGQEKISNLSISLIIMLFNILILCIVYLSGLLFSIGSVYVTCMNAAFYGYYVTVIGSKNFLLMVMPHGIFEIPSMIIINAAAFKLTVFTCSFIKSFWGLDFSGSFFDKYRYVYGLHKLAFKDSFKLLCVAVGLMVIAGIVEIYITPDVYYMFK